MESNYSLSDLAVATGNGGGWNGNGWGGVLAGGLGGLLLGGAFGGNGIFLATDADRLRQLKIWLLALTSRRCRAKPMTFWQR